MTKNNVITMANAKFGTVRKIVEGESVLYCGADIAKALGYTNSRRALDAHCRCVTKRYIPHPQSHDKTLEVSFVPEADVYRIICHSKLPSAMEFEKWVFEDVVPKAVDKQIKPEYEQLTLETSEYHYFPKTLNGEPVITVADFSHFTGIPRKSVYLPLKTHCKYGEDYFSLSETGLAQFKRENPNVSSLITGAAFVLKESAVRKLLKYFKLSVEIPMIEEKKEQKPVITHSQMSIDECVVALGVLGAVRSNLQRAENKEGEEAINTAIQYTSWELSKRMIGNYEEI